MAFFQFVSLRNKGQPLFSVEESAKAHNYAKWVNPYETAFFLMVATASLAWFLVYFYLNPQSFEALFGEIHETTLVGICVGVALAGAMSLIIFYPMSYHHVFYDRLLRFQLSYTRNSHYQWISVDRMERITLTPVSSGGQTFVLAHVILKPLFPIIMGRSWTTVRFGISEPKGIDMLRAWATARGIPIGEAPQKKQAEFIKLGSLT